MILFFAVTGDSVAGVKTIERDTKNDGATFFILLVECRNFRVLFSAYPAISCPYHHQCPFAFLDVFAELTDLSVQGFHGDAIGECRRRTA